MLAAEMDLLRAGCAKIRDEAAAFGVRVATLEEKITKTIETHNQFATEIFDAGHALRNLRVGIGILLAELDRLLPVAAASADASPSKVEGAA